MKKLTRKPQMFLYALAGMGVNMLNLMMGSYLCSALIAGGFGADVVKNQTFAGIDLVIPALWAVFALVAKILDGVIDVPMASLTDRLKTRWGRRRPSLLFGMLPMIASYLLFLFVPNPSGATLVNTIYYGVVLCVFYCSYTLTMVTYYATFTEIVETERERNFISNVKSVCDIVYFILGYVVVRMLLNSMNVQRVALIVLPLSLTMLIPLIMIKEPSSLLADAQKTHAPKTVNLLRSLAYTFRDRAFVRWMIVYSFMTFGVQLFLGGINEYFSYVGMSMIFVMVAAFVPVPLTLLLYNHITRKHGFGFSFRYVLITFSVGMLSMFAVSFLGAGIVKTVLSVASGLICSFAVGALFSVAYSVPSQLAAEEEQRTGISHSAMYFAVQGLFSGVATGIGTGVVLTALKSASAGTQTTGAMKYMTLICAAGTLVSCLLMATLPRSIQTMGHAPANKN